MKIVFLSNYFNHHQRPFSDEMFKLIGNGYFFIETEQMKKERIALGWQMNAKPSYVLQTYENLDKCKKVIDEADVVITGSAPEYLLSYRKKANKIIVRYSERLFKRIPTLKKTLKTFLAWQINNPFWKPIYMLCASGYTAQDCQKIHLFKNKTFKWGYFPEKRTYSNVKEMINKKNRGSILWAARFIDWKHPERMIQLAQKLMERNETFNITMIGCGELEEYIKNDVEKKGLSKYISFVGSLSPEMVRNYMEKNEIFISTSDRNEGWGVVLNEAMNSCCAVVADEQIGAAPFLIENGKNGMVYGSFDEMCENVIKLLKNDELRHSISQAAYNTIFNQWNPKKAAENCLVLCENLVKKRSCDFFVNGPCSRC